MPSIGSIRSVACDGGDGAPVFEANKQIKKTNAKVDKTTEKLLAQDKLIAELSANLAKIMAAQGLTGASDEDSDKESDKELAPQEKAARTRAENKAKAEAEADKDESDSE